MDTLCNLIQHGVDNHLIAPAGERITSKAAIQQWFRSKRWEVRNTLSQACVEQDDKKGKRLNKYALDFLDALAVVFDCPNLAVLHEVTSSANPDQLIDESSNHMVSLPISRNGPIPTARHRKIAQWIANQDQGFQDETWQEREQRPTFQRLDEDGNPYISPRK